MDLSIPRHTNYSDARHTNYSDARHTNYSDARQTNYSDACMAEQVYPKFAAPTPLNLSRNYAGNTLTPGAIPSPLNFPAITPPRSPYSYYGLYTPASTSRVSPLYDPSYLRRLKSNPMFHDLQSLLRQECLQMQVPASLITTSWNLMELPQTMPKTNVASSTCPKSASDESTGQHVYMRHMKLQDKLLKVRIDPAISADGLSVENDFGKEVGNIEMDRYRALHSCPSNNVKVTINSYFDKQRQSLADKTEAKLDTLIVKAEAIRKAVQKANSEKTTTSSTIQVHQPIQQVQPLGQGASLLLQPADKDKFNAVRKLKFNTSGDNVNVEEDDDDYLNCSVNSEDFQIDEIDVETVEKEEKVTPPTEEEESVTPPIHIQQTDILKQCIAESGINILGDSILNGEEDRLANLRQAIDTEGQFCKEEVIYPDSSTLDSPMSVDSVESSTTNPDLSTDCSHSSPAADGNSNSLHIPCLSKAKTSNNYNNQFYHTPQHQSSYKFSQTNNSINLALSEIQKLCSGPTVNFSPELRRDVTPSFTPETLTKFSPLSELCDNANGNVTCSKIRDSYATKNLTSAVGNSMWTTDTVSRPEVRMGTSQKRKSPCDSEPIDTHSINYKNNNINSNTEQFHNVNKLTSASEESDSNMEYKTPVFRTHKMLTADVTNILSHWYHAHVNYPYPNDEEVNQLAHISGITDRQVKKWMANKRVRCFNTLSITGNQHPIKYKYQGRKRKTTTTAATAVITTDKENCDSMTNDKKANYTMLTEMSKQMLNQWYNEHLDNPYPSDEEKQNLATVCRISINQVKSWFANKRNRTNNTKRQVPNYFINKFPEYSHMVQVVGHQREEARMIKRRKLNDFMYIQPPFYI